jgi:peptide deformylase
LKIARLGHPLLREKAKPLSRSELRDDSTQRLIDDMVETMRDYRGVGLAAPQVHEGRRILVVEEQPGSEDDARPTIPLTVLVNPVLTPIGEGRAEGWEGCLSIPDLRGKVSRWTALAVEGLDRRGRPVSYEARDFHARVLQHEVDHLDGVVFLDRMTDMATLTFLDEYAAYWRDEEE